MRQPHSKCGTLPLSYALSALLRWRRADCGGGTDWIRTNVSEVKAPRPAAERQCRETLLVRISHDDPYCKNYAGSELPLVDNRRVCE